MPAAQHVSTSKNADKVRAMIAFCKENNINYFALPCTIKRLEDPVAYLQKHKKQLKQAKEPTRTLPMVKDKLQAAFVLLNKVSTVTVDEINTEKNRILAEALLEQIRTVIDNNCYAGQAHYCENYRLTSTKCEPFIIAFWKFRTTPAYSWKKKSTTIQGQTVKAPNISFNLNEECIAQVFGEDFVRFKYTKEERCVWVTIQRISVRFNCLSNESILAYDFKCETSKNGAVRRIV